MKLMKNTNMSETQFDLGDIFGSIYYDNKNPKYNQSYYGWVSIPQMVEFDMEDMRIIDYNDEWDNTTYTLEWDRKVYETPQSIVSYITKWWKKYKLNENI